MKFDSNEIDTRVSVERAPAMSVRAHMHVSAGWRLMRVRKREKKEKNVRGREEKRSIRLGSIFGGGKKNLVVERYLRQCVCRLFYLPIPKMRYTYIIVMITILHQNKYQKEKSSSIIIIIIIITIHPKVNLRSN